MFANAVKLLFLTVRQQPTNM